MHFAQGQVSTEYTRYIKRKSVFILGSISFLVFLLLLSVSLGAVNIPLSDVVLSLLGKTISKRVDIIIWNIRLPQAFTAAVAGAGLAIAGAAMQAILRNPLGSPFTLGISHAAGFGAAFSVMVLGSGVMSSTGIGAVSISNIYVTMIMAFFFSLVAAGIIAAVSKIRGASPETMVLTGIALASLFTAGTMLLQFFADDVQLAAMVFWTFGDVARANWTELGVMAVIVVASAVYLIAHSWNYNAIEAGDETAKGLGVRVDRVRLIGMLVSSLMTAVIVAFLGIIGFVGLVCPHMVRRLIGGDHRFLMPATLFTGSIVLLGSDTVARLILAPHLLPVSVLTALIGAPVFIYLILRGYRR
jgi:iron complex transport system permease protein